MKITIDRPRKSILDGLLTWIKELSSCPDYESDRDLIADFVDKVVVAEAKKAATDASMVSEEIEVPNEIFEEPLKKKTEEIKATYAAKWAQLKKIINSIDPLEGGSFVPKLIVGPPSEEQASPPEVSIETNPHSYNSTKELDLPIPEPVDSQKITRNRIGNGHKKSMTRRLTGQERDGLRAFFLSKNGMLEDDDCVQYRSLSMDHVVGIFQVTGFISYLHREVAEGRTVVKDLTTYEEWMRTKYGQLWAQYNSPRFVDVRNQNKIARAKGNPATARVSPQQAPLTPAFTHFPKRKQTI